METLLRRAQAQWEQGRAFAVYRKPGDATVHAWFQNDDVLYELTDFAASGFVIAPFEGTAYVLPENHCDRISVHFDPAADADFTGFIPDSQAGKADFETLVAKGVQVIKSGNFDKLVLSRCEDVHITETDFRLAYVRLLTAYPNAFCYVIFHPELGLWLGATPERLLAVDENQRLQTMALAGTQTYDAAHEAVWADKEQQEQQFVTDFIASELKTLVGNVTLSAPYTHRAGNLVHIRTDVSALLKKPEDLAQVVQALHPTPAVCGLPKAEAKRFILAEEGYDRALYAGYLGLLHDDAATDLFVNLRCMQWHDRRATLYVGCGITRDSDPEKEYLETVHKTMTLKKILK